LRFKDENGNDYGLGGEKLGILHKFYKGKGISKVKFEDGN
jgi:hypothetical protein